MAAFYNEIDPYSAAWLRRLIAAGHIADGVVDERSIEDIHPAELREFTQCHFFAGIGVWSRSLRGAGWPDDRGVWTGSCPCQPFSAAGKGAGFADERHLWPAFHHLIAECRPPVVFGEQVASKDGLAWLDLVRTDLEAAGYAAGAADLCAAGIGAPHIRQRLWWVADANIQRGRGRELGHGNATDAGIASETHRLADARGGLDNNNNTGLEGQRGGHCTAGGRHGAVRPVGEAGESVGLADAQHDDGRADEPRWRPQGRVVDGRCGADGGLADAEVAVLGRAVGQGHIRHADGSDRESGGLADASGAGRREITGSALGDEEAHGREGWNRREPDANHQSASNGEDRRASPTHGFWGDADWLFCRDGKWRPVEPTTFPLAHGAAARVGRLRAYGNAIVPQVAETFIRAYLDIRG